MADLFFTLPVGLKRELETAAMNGVAKLKGVIKNKNSEWKKIPLNIAITRESGVGKSSFINAIRGLTADDNGAAPVGSVETTKDIKSYEHPSNENMLLWDLPGVGTANFPQNTYLEKVKFQRFDFFLILSASRFREADILLAKEIRNLNKNFHFVRTQMRLEIEKDKDAHPKTHDKSNLLQQIRDDCLTQLEKSNCKVSSVFLIDSYKRSEFDFDVLATTLIDEAPEHKKEAMALSLSLVTSGVLEKKVEALSNRILKVSLFSAVGGAIPIPLIGAMVDGAVMLEEVIFYKKQLGIDEKTMEENARLLKTDARTLEKRLCLQSLSIAQTAKGLVQTTSCIIVDEAIETALPIAIPVIGSLVSAGISYGATVASLKYLLKLCSDDARKITEELIQTVFN